MLQSAEWEIQHSQYFFHCYGYTTYNITYNYLSPCKIHLWRHSIVLALHYFQGMACFRSATLLEVMDTRSFWIMFVFTRVIYLRSCICEVHSHNSCFSINKKKTMVTARLEPTPSKTTLDVVFSFESSALPTELSRRWRRMAYFRYIKYITRERGIYIICIDTWTL